VFDILEQVGRVGVNDDDVIGVLVHSGQDLGRMTRDQSQLLVRDAGFSEEHLRLVVILKLMID
jgi:hypothetical protein